MVALLFFLLRLLLSPFRPISRLEAENAALRRQLMVLQRQVRAGFRRYWRWKSRSLGGKRSIDAGLRALIRQMSIENVLWGAPRIQGELLRLGFAVAQSTVAKYMAKRGGPSGQTWGTFLRNHAPHIAAMFVVPT